MKLGIYENIFRAWSDRRSIEAALTAAAEYHVQRIRERRNEDIYEFSSSPLDVFPAELHAIYKTRERLGLQTPAVDHPLMNTPFGHAPSGLPPAQDELLESVLATVREVMPDL